MPRKAKATPSSDPQNETSQAEPKSEATAALVRGPAKRVRAVRKPAAAAVPARQRSRKSQHELDAALLDAVAQALPGPDAAFQELRKDHAEGKADLGALLSRSAFSAAFLTWLANMKYQIGLDPRDFKADKEVNWAKHLASIGGKLLSYSGPMFISGGATSDRTFPVLLPFIPLADIVAFQVKNGAPVLILAIYADGLSPATLTQRFQQYLELAKPLQQFGLQLNGSATVAAGVCPLLVFFDENCYQAAVRDLLPQAQIKKFWDKLNLAVGFVNVPGRQVIWPEPHGLEVVGAWLAKTFHQQLYPFETADLLNVITLAGLP